MPGETEPPIIDSTENNNEGGELKDPSRQPSKMSTAVDLQKDASHVSLTKAGGEGQVGSKQPTQASLTAVNKQPSTVDAGNKSSSDQLPPVTAITDNPAADLRHMRHIIAEDPDWSLAIVPSLVEICLRHIVTNFLSKY